MLTRIRAFFRNRKLDRDFSQELESHISMMIEENIRRGMTPDEARRAALMRFGGRASLMEQHREIRGLPVLDAFLQDVRYAFRVIRKNPGFASVAILSLGIGIAANTAMFSLVNAVLLRPLAYRDPQRIFDVGELSFTNGTQLPNLVNPMHAKEWQKGCPSVEQVSLMRGATGQLSGGAESLSVPAADVSHNLFALFGVEPIFGRVFLPEEEIEGNDRVVILSESLWRSRFNSDSSVIGTSIVVDSISRQVVGVLPASFRMPRSTNSRVQIFRPLVLSPEEIGRVGGNFNYGGLIRVRSGVTMERRLRK